MDALGMPWATHTLTGHPACDYNPLNPQPDDVHGREFYTYTDSIRTDEAARHIYAELVARSLQMEGEYIPIDLDTRDHSAEQMHGKCNSVQHIPPKDSD